jgi:hypothetical protein
MLSLSVIRVKAVVLPLFFMHETKEIATMNQRKSVIPFVFTMTSNCGVTNLLIVLLYIQNFVYYVNNYVLI